MYVDLHVYMYTHIYAERGRERERERVRDVESEHTWPLSKVRPFLPASPSIEYPPNKEYTLDHINLDLQSTQKNGLLIHYNFGDKGHYHFGYFAVPGVIIPELAAIGRPQRPQAATAASSPWGRPSPSSGGS